MPLRRGGPWIHQRLDLYTKVEQGWEVTKLIHSGLSFRQASAQLGMSLTTAWRRYWFFEDYWALPRFYGRPSGPVPPQRGTRECPRGRPWLPTVDGER